MVEALGPIVHAPERYSKGQEEEVLSRLFSDVCRMRPEWQEDIRHDQLVGIARELFSRRGPAWDVFQQTLVPAGPPPVPMVMADTRAHVTSDEKVGYSSCALPTLPSGRPMPFTDNTRPGMTSLLWAPPARPAPSPDGHIVPLQVEVLVPLVRAAYGDVFWRIAQQDITLPQYVRSPLDYTQAPPEFPLLRGLSPLVRERVLREGLAPFVSRDGPVRLSPTGEVEVSLELLSLLYTLFFLSQSSVTCQNAVLRDVVNAAHRLVKETARELMAR